MNTNTDQGIDLTLFKLGFISGWITTLMDFFYKLPISDMLKFIVLIVTLISGLVLLANHIVTLRMNIMKLRKLSKNTDLKDNEEDS
jgi:uncharacterized membrane protein YciS (DUF1049 family)